MLLTEPQFDYLQTCVRERAGVMLPNHGLSQASLRLCSVLRQLELPDFDGLISLMHAPAMERTLHGLVVEELIAPQTFFFERYEIFKGLRHSILPKLMAQKTGQEKTLRIWVPNCRRGQDAHSLAIMFNEAMPELKNWDIEIWATAPKGDELAQARSGKFSAAQVANGLPAGLKRKSFSPHANHFRVQARHRRLVEFYRLALHEPWNKLCQFDVIFLRNSLSYMPAYDKAKLLDRLGQQLTPEGVLLFGDGAQNIVHPHFESSPELPTHSLNQREPMTLASTRQTTALQSASCMQAEHPAESDTGEIDFREILDAVRDLDLFTLMSIQDVETICRNMEVVKYKSGATLMREGDVSSNFFVVLEGELRVTMRTTFGRPNRELAVLGAGEVVGEMSHLLNLPCNATVKALGTCRVLQFGADLFRQLLDCNDFFKENLQHVAYSRRSENSLFLASQDLKRPVWSLWGDHSHNATSISDVPHAEIRGAVESQVDADAMRTLGKLAQRINLFGDISIQELEAICDQVTVLNVPGSVPILQQGSPGDRLYIISQGTARVVMNQRFPWRGTTISLLSSADMFGEISLLRGTQCSASVVTDGPVELFAMNADYFRTLYRNNPRFRACIDQSTEERESRLANLVA